MAAVRDSKRPCRRQTLLVALPPGLLVCVPWFLLFSCRRSSRRFRAGRGLPGLGEKARAFSSVALRRAAPPVGWSAEAIARLGQGTLAISILTTRSRWIYAPWRLAGPEAKSAEQKASGQIDSKVR